MSTNGMDPNGSQPEELDIVVVGAGLTGLFLTHLLLESYGVDPARIALLERQPKRYDLPRAAGFSDDNARLYRACMPKEAVDKAVQKIVRPGFTWQWRDRHGDVLYDAKWGAVGPSGYDIIQGFHQPLLEGSMEDLIRARGHNIVRFSHDVADLTQDEDGVKLFVKDRNSSESRTIRSRWVVGADSANSTIRDLVKIDFEDQGFAYDWLVVDLLPDAETYRYINFELGYFQHCDPARPTTCVWSGPGRRRFEFMRLPGESKEELVAKTWELLATYKLNPQNVEIERSAMYTFRARIVDRFKAGRCILAGDAAHLTPPFLGQGAQMGIRDAANLAWRLALVLAGSARKEILEGYSPERRAPCKFLIVGKIICVSSDEEADRLHAEFRAQDAKQVGDHPLGKPGQYTDHPAAGHLSLHRPVKLPDGTEKLLDEVIGRVGWRLMGWGVDPLKYGALTPQALKVAKLLGIVSVEIDASKDVTGDWGRWFTNDVGNDVVLVRPDFFVGDACRKEDVSDLLENLARLLLLEA